MASQPHVTSEAAARAINVANDIVAATAVIKAA